MTESEKLYIKSTATELVAEISKLYSEGDGERGSPFGILNLPKPLYKYRDQLATIYILASNLKVDLEDKL